jgi:hypothetical protein
MIVKSTRYWKRTSQIDSRKGDDGSTILSIVGTGSFKQSEVIRAIIDRQLQATSDVARFASNWSIKGSISDISEVFTRKMPDGRSKVIRLHNTESNLKGDVSSTINNLIEIGVYRSSNDPSSEKKFTSPVHIVEDGYFALGYDLILIPELIAGSAESHINNYALRAVVNPTSNYTKWIDVAVVGSYHINNELSFAIDSLIYELITSFGSHLNVCDHHAFDPGSFGVGSTNPVAVSSLIPKLKRVVDTLAQTPKYAPLAKISSEMFGYLSAISLPFDSADVLSQLAEQQRTEKMINIYNKDQK